jgi:type IV secretory pathway VirJ component
MRAGVRIAALCVLGLAGCGEREPGEIKLKLDPYGEARVFRHAGQQRDAAIVFSGAEGWTAPLSSRAWGIAWPDRVVIGIDLPRYLRNIKPSSHDGAACLDFTATMPSLLRAVADAVHGTVDPAPLVLGYGDGGAVALAAAAQSQPKTVEGVIAEDFCPRLAAPLPPCPGPGGGSATALADGGFALGPATQLHVPFVAIADGARCPAVDLEAFVEAMPDARTVDPVPARAVDLMVSVATQTGANVAAIPAVSDADLADLPLIEVPSAPGRDDRLAIILTGDGGWADIDRSIGETLAARGVAVVGFSTLKYFWKPQTPEQAAEDLERVIRHYSEAWNRRRILLVGYSFGAGVLPFLLPRLPEDMRRTIALTVLLAPPARADFEISVGGWIGEDSSEGPEVASAIGGLERPVLCVRSEGEDDSPCPAGGHGRIATVTLKGDHHFDGAYGTITDRILAASAAP